MNYLQLFTPHNLALISDWIDESGLLLVHVYTPHSGSSGDSFLVRTMKDLKELVMQQTNPEIEFSVFRKVPFQLHGCSDSSFLETAMHVVSDGEVYEVFPATQFYPMRLDGISSGNSHAELRNDLMELKGEWVYVSKDINFAESRLPSNQVFKISVHKNQNYYELYDRNPALYEELERMWSQPPPL